jgi:hypothetical protein
MRKVKLAGHTAHMEEMRNDNKIMGRKLERKKLL